MGKKHAQHNKKQGSHSLLLQTGNLPCSSCVSIKIFNLTSQIDIEWCRLLFHGLLGDRFMVWISTYWRPWGDFVGRRFLERGLVSNKYISSILWISEIYIAHKKQESGEPNLPVNFKGFSIRHWHFVDCCLM